jgi:hypothetical protein
MSSVSNGCPGRSNCCCMLELVLYCFHNHSSLSLGMVIRWFPLFVNIEALSYIIWMVGLVVFISVLGLHSFRFI